MSDQKSKKRKKQYYKQCASKKSRRNELEGGMCGFLLTCNNREKDAVREAYSLLNQYAEQLYGPEQAVKGEGADNANSGSESEEEDLEKALQKEVTAIKDIAKTERRFQVVDTSANNVLFIRTTLEHPHELAHTIMSDIYTTQTSKSRYIMRFLPVVGTCKTHDAEKILKCAKEALTPFFGRGESHTFSILFKARNNNKVTRNDILKPLAQIIFDLNPGNQTDYESPEFVINVDVIRSICCISVAKDFYKFSKYNLQEVTAVKVPKVADLLPVDKSDSKNPFMEKNVVANDGDSVDSGTGPIDETQSESPVVQEATVTNTDEAGVAQPSDQVPSTQCPSDDSSVLPADVTDSKKPNNPQDGSGEPSDSCTGSGETDVLAEKKKSQ